MMTVLLPLPAVVAAAAAVAAAGGRRWQAKQELGRPAAAHDAKSPSVH